MDDLLQDDPLERVQACASRAALAELRSALLGRSGSLTSQLRSLGSLPTELRRSQGARLNALRSQIEAALDAREAELQVAEQEQRLSAEALDLTLPAPPLPRGGPHPISCVLDELRDIFQAMGYRIAEGPEVEDELHNFDALNIPAHHPARDLQDTFWLKDGRVLRTHTSPVQVRYMVAHEPPFKIVVPGKVYRYEATDATNEAMFHQLEGLLVADQVSMADLKGTLRELARGLFGPAAEVRFQPSYYPFVEPGADFAAWWENPKGPGKWLELGGAGMVHPQVFAAVDQLRVAQGKAPCYQGKMGFAFGLGPNRIAMLRYAIPDIRHFYANDPRVLAQFRGMGS